MDKLFVVKKYVVAKSALQAIEREKECVVDDVWVDDDFRKQFLEFKPNENPAGFVGTEKGRLKGTSGDVKP